MPTKGQTLSSPSITRRALCAGLVAGGIFPVYASLTLGPSRAFTPLFVGGSLFIGLTVGYLASRLFIASLARRLSSHGESLERLIPGSGTIDFGEDRTPEDCEARFERLTARLAEYLEATREKAVQEQGRSQQLAELCRQIVRDSRAEAEKFQETSTTISRMDESYSETIRDIDALEESNTARLAGSNQLLTSNLSMTEGFEVYSTSMLECSASIEQMAQSIKETAANVSGFEESLDQTASSINQISATIANVRDNSRHASDCSEKVRAQAQEGMRAMTATLKAMGEIEKSNVESFNAINRLSVHTAKVGDLLNIISEVVEQTNLLSLNASIIAAQAGERGKAFAVVAEEVRGLARRTAASTKEIEELVRNIRRETAAVQLTVTQGKDRVKQGVKISAMTSEALTKIEESADVSSEMIKMIAAATNEQAAGSNLIGEEAEKNLERVRQLNRAVREQERGITQIVTSLDTMRQLSADIKGLIREQTGHHERNRINLVEDGEKIKNLRLKSVQQMMMADQAVSAVGDLAACITATTRDAEKLLEQGDRPGTGEIVQNSSQPTHMD